MSKRLVIFSDLQITGMHYTALWDSRAVNTPHSPAISAGILFDQIEDQLSSTERAWFFDGPRNTPEAKQALGERALACEQLNPIVVSYLEPDSVWRTTPPDCCAKVVTVRYQPAIYDDRTALQHTIFWNELLVVLSGGETYYLDLTELLALSVWETGGICEVSTEPPLKHPLPEEGESPVDIMEMLYCPARAFGGCHCH